MYLAECGRRDDVEVAYLPDGRRLIPEALQGFRVIFDDEDPLLCDLPPMGLCASAGPAQRIFNELHELIDVEGLWENAHDSFAEFCPYDFLIIRCSSDDEDGR